ncbi:MAG: hypothetical protein LBR00_00460 [Clostridiales Family XIII bacterium]|nr:hypothetical protein [Clostridiales Family XIII bacterium]
MIVLLYVPFIVYINYLLSATEYGIDFGEGQGIVDAIVVIVVIAFYIYNLVAVRKLGIRLKETSGLWRKANRAIFIFKILSIPLIILDVVAGIMIFLMAAGSLPLPFSIGTTMVLGYPIPLISTLNAMVLLRIAKERGVVKRGAARIFTALLFIPAADIVCYCILHRIFAKVDLSQGVFSDMEGGEQEVAYGAQM